jgi:GH43 family beta-xylosidase
MPSFKHTYPLLFCLVCSVALTAQTGQTFSNPLLPSGPDPFSFYKDGFYYYTHTLGNRIGIWKTNNLANLATATHTTIYTPPAGTAWCKELWAPEIVFLRGKWYVYFAADDGQNKNHRLYVLENAAADPLQGEWIFKGKISDTSDKWAIDGDVFEYRHQLYMVWSGWEGDTNGEQDIYIAAMEDPWTISSKRVRISAPVHNWERQGDLKNETPPHINVNEGPQALIHGSNLFVVYSASACWTDDYALGLLRFTGSDNLLDPGSWIKSPEPVFKQSPANSVFATGHNSFFISPDGKENWILYHANSHPGDGCGNKRSPRAQPFGWTTDGLPDFGIPVKEGLAIPIPSAIFKRKNR